MDKGKVGTTNLTLRDLLPFDLQCGHLRKKGKVRQGRQGKARQVRTGTNQPRHSGRGTGTGSTCLTATGIRGKETVGRGT